MLGAAIFFLIGLGYFFYSLQPISAVENENSWIEFKIVKGDSFRNIGAQLSQQSLIKSIAVFKLYALLSGRARPTQIGNADVTCPLVYFYCEDLSLMRSIILRSNADVNKFDPP